MNIKTLNFLVTLVLAIVFSFFLPWWSIMLAAFITAVLLSIRGVAVFFIPFVAIFVFWVSYSFILSNTNDFTLAKKIAILLPLDGNAYLLLIITGIVGGLAGGVAGIFGKQCKALIKK
ncbi:MAG: hypothetical protein KAJ23_11955 [Maribacter sp.]|nr:hypothetical protein [Maribacter sp.]